MNFFLLDVFGNSRYTGNQLAVCLDYGKLTADEMQKITREINFSETTFITAREKTNDGYPVRIFTPGSEVDFAGHPTLGTAFVIHNYIQDDPSDVVKLNLKAGQIPVTFQGDTLWMKQNQPIFGKVLDNIQLAEILGLQKADIDERFPIQEVSTGLPFVIVPLKTIDALKRSKVNQEKYLNFIKNAWAKGIFVFCPEGHEANQDLSSRAFVDIYGIPEDPATGSATGCLAAWLVRYAMFGKSALNMTIGQGYEIGRPSELKIKAGMEGNEFEIRVGGKVIEIAAGTWRI